MTDLRAALTAAADDLVPERDPLEGRLDGVRRLVRRRRAVRRAQAGAGALVGVAALGSTSMLLWPEPNDPAGVAGCGDVVSEVLPAAGDLGGFATVQRADGLSISVRTQLENLGDVEVTTTGEVQLILSAPGTGEVLGTVNVEPGEQATVAAGISGDVFMTASLTDCDGEPLADGSYDLTVTGTARAADGTEVGWSAPSSGITVTDGAVQEESGPAEAFAPVCGEMIPAVAENPMWASTAAAGVGPFQPGDPDAPYTQGMALDLTIGTTSHVALSGEVSPEIVTVLTDLDGTVLTWWRASEHGRPLDLGPSLALASQSSTVLEGFAWFPVLDTCANVSSAIPDGVYRLFTWTEVTVRAEGSDAVEHYPMVSVPLDVTVTDGAMSAG